MLKKILLFIFLIFVNPNWASFWYLILLDNDFVSRFADSYGRTVFVENANLESMPGIEILDANNIYFQVVETEPNRFDIDYKKDSNLYTKKSRCRVKMFRGQSNYINVKLNNKEYPALIDTGFPEYFMINDVIIIENKLKILPFKLKPHVDGFSWMDEVQIGSMRITDIFSYYQLGHYEKQLFGKTMLKQGYFFLGLKFLRRFKYILFDNINSEVEFSPVSFRAEPNEQWKQYKMSFEKYYDNLTRTMVEIPIAGDSAKIMLDTGAGISLLMSQSKWEKFSEKVDVIKEANARIQAVHGLDDVNEIIVEELIVGEKRIPDAPIHIFSDDSLLGPDYFILGIGCFKDTVIVLDFEHNLLWIKRTTALVENN